MGSWTGAARRYFYFSSSRPSEEQYELLQQAENGSPLSPRRKPHPPHLNLRSLLWVFTIRRIATFIFCIFSFFVLTILWSGIPPSFSDIREYERRLPQHDLSLPFPEGEKGVYLRFPGHIWGHGLNNILQETIMMSHLAYLSNRSYVFEDYVWSHTPLPYTIYDFALRPARVPLNAFIAGPSAGGPMPHPRAVSAEFYEKACPKHERVFISSVEAKDITDSQELLAWWAQKIQSTSARCVEVGNDPPIFDWFFFGTDRVLSIWPSLASSPILEDFTWSPLVTSGVARNLNLLSHNPLAIVPETINGLVAVHLRRGDYARHCPRLEEWDATFMGFNLFPSLPDKFQPPQRGSGEAEVQVEKERKEYYMSHCWPEIDDIVLKLKEVRKGRPDLQRVFILTNGWESWVESVKTALHADGWAGVVSSYDMLVDSEQKYVAMAIDMAVAERAEVFVGNGFSSLTANVVMLRTVKGFNPQSNRFW